MCDVNTRLAHRQMKFFAVLVGRQCLTQVRHAEKFPTGPDKQPWYTTYTMELGMSAATILSATDNNKGWDTLIIFWQRATPINFYLISSDNFIIITFLSCISWLATTRCPCSAPSRRTKHLCERIVFFTQFSLICLQKLENKYVHIYTEKFGECFCTGNKVTSCHNCGF